MASFNIERFKRLPQHPSDVWQGGVFAMPAWVEGPDGKPFRPKMAIWVSTAVGVASEPRPIEPDDDPQAAAVDSLLDFALTNDEVGRPSAVAVNDPQLADYLADCLSGTGVRFECVPALDEAQRLLNDMAEQLTGSPEPPGALEAKGVTVERLRAFAEAAAAFYSARPWEELTGEDLIAVEHPKPPAGLGYCSVLGAAGHTFGLGFFKTPKQYEKMHAVDHPSEFLARHGVWSLSFDTLTDLPLADAELWERHDLPVAGEEAYPCVAYFGPRAGVRRPDARQLAFLEGLMRAISRATGDHLDAGQWSTTVPTFDGPKKYRLALPSMLHGESSSDASLARLDLDPRHARRVMERGMANLQRLVSEGDLGSIDEINAFLAEHGADLCEPAEGPLTPLEQAQEMMYEAWEARGRKRRKLANKALDICPDCADAYVLLAEETGDTQASCELFRKGVEAGERALGPATFKEETGHFWGILETRPYMRARAGLAQCLWALDKQKEAVGHYGDLLRLNPDDNQGIRYLLAPCLLHLGRDKELASLLEDHDDGTAQWQYLEALSIYRRDGDTPLARRRLKRAIRSNRHVPDFILGRRGLPENDPGAISLGGEDEAACCAAELEEGWRATPGALDWLGQLERSGSKKR